MAAKQDFVKLVIPTGAKSAVWDSFGLPVYEKNGVRTTDKSKVICKVCDIQLKYNGNTTNMMKHLSRHHPSAMLSPTCGGTKSTNIKKENDTDLPRASSSGQLLLTDLKKHTKYSSDSTRAKALNRKVGVFIAKDLRPLSIVDNKHFREFVTELDPRYSLPTRKHFSDKIIPQLYCETKEKVLNDIKKADSIALTTDSWTSRMCQSYVTITVHFMLSDWDMQSYVLQTRHLDVSHTGVNIGQVLREAVREWGLPTETDIPLVTDNASNMDIAAKTADLQPHIGCFAHTVNLACQRGLKVPALGRLLGRIRKVVCFFHRSSTATAVLKAKQGQLSLTVHKLVQDVQTRWNSSFDMIQRYLEQEPAIHAALSSPEVKKPIKDIVTLSSNDISDAEQIMKVLEPLKTVTNIMCAEHTPTVSLIYPMKAVILENMSESVHDSNLVRDVKQAIRNDLIKRYSEEDTAEFLLMCAALDPRFMGLPRLEPDKRDEIYSNIESIVDMSSGSTDGDLCPPPAKKSAIEQLLGDVYIVSVSAAKTIEERVKSELETYKAKASIPLSSCPLLWWRTSEESFPLLAKLAKRVLGIPSTSVASERVFSTAGDIITATRSALNPDNVDRLIFLKRNL
ncbi:E3 SUMO-protein ligase ZBED1-like [Ostrea edulis]|uniref:E3 SUMO-protein ligase ZBED1-like n=1 Tax=Ostrea edulis TaxID=37623 RepID=UPI0024AFEDBD|nr:E3 SUMO-protein ligase ZBED1-like [Ostrea edulis]